jgi:hypothetical protein
MMLIRIISVSTHYTTENGHKFSEFDVYAIISVIELYKI